MHVYSLHETKNHNYLANVIRSVLWHDQLYTTPSAMKNSVQGNALHAQKSQPFLPLMGGKTFSIYGVNRQVYSLHHNIVLL